MLTFVHFVGRQQHFSDQGMSRFMKGDASADFFIERRIALEASDNPFNCQIEIGHRDLFAAGANGHQGGFIDDVRQVSTGKTGRDLRQAFQISVGAQGDVTSVDL